MAFTETFGGTTIYPSDVSYRAISLSANQELSWPLEVATSGNVVAQIMDVTPSAGGFTITMPPANEASPGETALFFNAGSFNFTVADNAGNTIVTITPGLAYQVYLTTNTTVAGTWRTTQFGAGTSSATAGSLVGAGIKAINTTLNQSMAVTSLSVNYTAGAADRSAAFLWTGGAGTITLPAASTVGNDWFFHIRNGGTGAISLATTGGELINGTATVDFNPGDSAIIVCDGTGYFTIGFGQAPEFLFDYVSIDLTSQSSPYTLAGSNLNRIAYQFSGTLTTNMEIIVPATIQQYWVGNFTTGGSYTLTVKTSAGTGVVVPRDARAILYCNGTDVVTADTGGISIPILVSQGGTGATNASSARTNLGATSIGNALFIAVDEATARNAIIAAKSGANSDITSLTGLTTPLSVPQGGTGAATFTANGLIYGSGTSALGVTAVGTTGQVLVGNTGGAPSWATLSGIGVTSFSAGTTGLTPSSATSGAITLAGTLIVANGGTGATTLTGYVKGSGTSALTASATIPATDISGGAALTKTDDTNVTLTLGGTPASALLAATSLTLGWSGQLSVARGGTGASTLTANGVLYGAGTSAIAATAVGTTGQVLVGNTGAAPSWATLTGIGVTSFSGGTTGLTPNTATTGAITLAGTLGVANGGTGVTTSTGTGSVVLSNSPTLVTPTLGAASATSIANALGAVGTPSYTFTGDLNTGMWSPAADTLAFSEGGVEAMRITSAGNVGIGTSSPNSKLDVSGTRQSATIKSIGNFTDTQSFAVDVGAGVGFVGKYNTAGDIAHYGLIAGRKENATDGNYAGYLALETRPNGGELTERMRITSTGNVGIGTATPAAKLQIQETTGTSGFESGMSLTNAVDSNLFLQITGSANTDKRALISTSTVTPIAFATNSVERMRVTATGNVGIGTATPDIFGRFYTRTVGINSSGTSMLQINGTTYGGIDLGFNGTRTATMLAETGGFYLQTTTASAMSLGTDSLERMRITSAGDVGIGTATPAQKLQVSGSSTSPIAISINNNDPGLSAGSKLSLAYGGTETGYVLSRFDGTDFFSAYGSARAHIFFIGATERMRVAADGNVGIGTSSPGSKLSVVGTINASDGTNGNIRAYVDGTSAYLQSLNQAANAYRPLLAMGSTVSFANNGVTNVTIDTSGNVGIGTTAPLSRLDVREANRADSTNIANVGIYTTTAQAINVGGTLALGGLFNGSDTAPFGSIRGGKQNSTSGNYDGYLAFQTIANGGVLTENMRITAAGNVNISNGNLVIGTALKGIDFSADSHAAGMTSELLDDYEEGTFTPTLSSDGTPPTVTGYANRYGSYTKIGNRVYISVNIRATVTAVGTGTPQVTGFPYAANSSTLNGVSLGLTDLMTVPFNANYINGSTLILALGAYTVVTNGYLTFSAMYEIN